MLEFGNVNELKPKLLDCNSSESKFNMQTTRENLLLRNFL